MPRSLKVDNLTANDFSKVLITAGSPGTDGFLNVTGYALNDLALSSSNEFASLFGSEALNQLAQKLDLAKSSAAALGIGDSNRAALNSIIVRTKEQTVYNWSGSTRPTITVNLLFVRVRESDNIIENALKLYRATLPVDVSRTRIQPTEKPDSKKRAGVTQIEAPLGYKSGLAGEGTTGTISIQIGTWFKANNLVARTCDFTYSKEVTPDGAPLYAQGSITLEPYSVITLSDYNDYFPNMSG